jgi:hypothetical protein
VREKHPCVYFLLSSTDSMRAVKLHWLDNILFYMITDHIIAFLLPDSCRATKINVTVQDSFGHSTDLTLYHIDNKTRGRDDICMSPFITTITILPLPLRKACILVISSSYDPQSLWRKFLVITNITFLLESIACIIFSPIGAPGRNVFWSKHMSNLMDLSSSWSSRTQVKSSWLYLNDKELEIIDYMKPSKIYLDGNPLQCSCRSLQFLKWIKKIGHNCWRRRIAMYSWRWV